MTKQASFTRTASKDRMVYKAMHMIRRIKALNPFNVHGYLRYRPSYSTHIFGGDVCTASYGLYKCTVKTNNGNIRVDGLPDSFHQSLTGHDELWNLYDTHLAGRKIGKFKCILSAISMVYTYPGLCNEYDWTIKLLKVYRA
ncbi:MAG: hypothetical protein H6550_16200 [Chitinophagales bacterium]|nr:hypothetical protein [Chitinophagales bacterium]